MEVATFDQVDPVVTLEYWVSDHLVSLAREMFSTDREVCECSKTLQSNMTARRGMSGGRHVRAVVNKKLVTIHPNPGPPGLVIVHRNFNGMTYKKQEAAQMVLAKEVGRVDVIIAMETYFTDEDARQHKLNAGGHQWCCYHRPRPRGEGENCRGGVAIFVRTADNIAHRIVGTSPEKDMDVEAVTVEITMGVTARNFVHKEVIHVTGAYAPKGKVDEDKLNRAIPTGAQKHVLAIDANVHHWKWDNKMKTTSAGKKLYKWSLEKGFDIMNDPSVHTWERRPLGVVKRSSPDVTLIRGLNAKNWKTVWNSDADHAFLCLELETTLGVVEKQQLWKFVYAKADKEEFYEECEKQCANAETYEEWEEAVVTAAYSNIPRGRRGHEPRWSKDSYKVLETVIAYDKEYRENPTNENYNKMSASREDWDKAVQKEKRENFYSWTAEIAASDKKAWAAIRGHGKTTNDTTGSAIVHNKKILHTQMEKADAFIDGFEKVASRRPGKRKMKRIKLRGAIVKSITMGELSDAMSKMKTGKASGLDEIQAEMLVLLGPIALGKLLQFINYSLAKGILPQHWKQGIIIPLLKPGKDSQKLEAYRPVTLTSQVSKLMERIIARRLLVEVGSKLHTSQYGFLPNHSTTEALLRFADLADSSEDNEELLTLFLDFTSAFDTLDHAAIMEKLEELNVDVFTRKWIKNFLSGRQSAVRVGTKYSNWREFTAGVPQGTVLGPLLFIICVDSLLGKLDSFKKLFKVMFADDLTVSLKSKNVDEDCAVIQEVLDVTSKWNDWSGMRINVGKSPMMVINPKGISSKISRTSMPKLGAETLKQVIEAKTLGIWIDEGFTFNGHGERMITEFDNRMDAIRIFAGSRKGVDTKALRVFNMGYVESKILYGSELYFHRMTNKRIRDRLEIKHRETLRIVTGLNDFAPNVSIYAESNSMDLDSKIKVRSAVFHMRLLAGWKDQKEYETLLWNKRKRQDTGRCISDIHRALGVVCQRQTGFQERYPIPEIVGSEGWKANVTVGGRLSTKKKSDIPKSEQLRLVESKLKELGEFNVEIWPDGAVYKDEFKTGTGVYVWFNDEKEPDKKKISLQRYTGQFASSYTAEGEGIAMGLEEVVKKLKGLPKECVKKMRILTATDSLSRVENAMHETGVAVKDELGRRIVYALSTLAVMVKEVVLQHVYSHCGVIKNEEVDDLAKNAAEDAQHIYIPVVEDYIAAMKRGMQKKWREHLVKERRKIRHIVILPTSKDLKSDCPRELQTLRAQLRAGCCMKFGELLRRVNTTMAVVCRWCCSKLFEQKKWIRPKHNQRIQCPYCPESLCRPYVLKQHIKRWHAAKEKADRKNKAKKNNKKEKRKKQWRGNYPQETLQHMLECNMLKDIRNKRMGVGCITVQAALLDVDNLALFIRDSLLKLGSG